MGRRDEARGGEVREYEALIEAYSGYIYAIVHRIVSLCASREDIEECVADVLVALWRSRAQYDPEKGDYKHYIAAIARNKAITLKGRLTKQDWLPLDEDILKIDSANPQQVYEQREVTAILSEAIDQLEPPDPEIFTRRYFWGDALRDIAQALNLSERAVEGRLYRGRKQLKVWLEGRL